MDVAQPATGYCEKSITTSTRSACEFAADLDWTPIQRTNHECRGQPATLMRRRSQWFDRQMTTVELVRSTALTDTVPYAYAAVAPPGRLVFTAGACPLDHDGAIVSPNDVAAQAQRVMANLAVALRAAGAGLTDVAKTTVYVASSSRTDLVTAWQVVRDAFGDHDAPSTLLGVAVLGYPGQLVEVEAVAVTHSSFPRP